MVAIMVRHPDGAAAIESAFVSVLEAWEECAGTAAVDVPRLH
jgi:hypothetical protein